ncbi:hypothetical protein [uncultured Phascolarctobacterium sp.]|jgi:hypothetical protein|nr:hypothetical protein [uncultured Phascolarctobacterium sp.]
MEKQGSGGNQKLLKGAMILTISIIPVYTLSTQPSAFSSMAMFPFL